MTDINLRELPRKLKFICIHWSAGAYTNLEREYYHFSIDPSGTVHEGLLKPEANIPPLYQGKYVPHCGGGNSYAIGVALLGMAGYKSPKAIGNYPLKQEQCEAAWAKVAELCHKYQIPVTPDTVYTHYEFGKRNPKTTSAGKIDIVFLPFKPELTPDRVGDYIRGKVKWYLAKLESKA